MDGVGEGASRPPPCHRTVRVHAGLTDNRLSPAAIIGAGDGGLPREYHYVSQELISLIGSARLREEVARGKGAMRLQSRSGDDHRAGFI